MAFRVPPQYLLAIQSFLELSDELIQGFLDSLAKAGSKFNTNDLAIEVAHRAKMPRRIADGVVQALATLYRLREEQGVPLETFVDEQVVPALKAVLVQANKDKAEAHTAQDAEVRWAKFRKFFIVALALDDTVGIAAKAGPVMTEHERIFEDARILTDVRLIFHPDLSEKPNAAVLVHMLRITTRNLLGNEQAEFFALDSNDIRLMKQLMDRAIKKEETIKKVMNNSGIKTIDPKGFF